MLQPAFERPAPLETPGADEAAIPTRDYRKYLDPKTLARICSLDLRARLVVEGYITGMHRSPYRGFSIEFAEHRQYVQGDDTRHIDWAVTARTTEPHVRDTIADRELELWLIVDASKSLDFGTARSEKRGAFRRRRCPCSTS